MANIGLRKPILFPWLGNKQYGEAMVVGKAVSCNVKPNYAEGALYGDDGLAEYNNAFTNADITMGTTTIPKTVAAGAFGHKMNENQEIVFNKDDESIYVGAAFIGSEVIDSKQKFTAVFVYKAKFAEPGDDYETKGENISYKTPAISGKAQADDDGDWKISKSFDTETEALTWVYTTAGQEVPTAA